MATLDRGGVGSFDFCLYVLLAVPSADVWDFYSSEEKTQKYEPPESKPLCMIVTLI